MGEVGRILGFDKLTMMLFVRDVLFFFFSFVNHLLCLKRKRFKNKKNDMSLHFCYFSDDRTW